MTATAWNAWNPPPAPERDLWWHAQRITVPDTDDHTARHQRGSVRLPYDLNADFGHVAGALVPAWVCCDPACGGVELGEHVLNINHGCCDVIRCGCHPKPTWRGQHRTGLGGPHFTGYHDGPFTAWWEPS